MVRVTGRARLRTVSEGRSYALFSALVSLFALRRHDGRYRFAADDVLELPWSSPCRAAVQ
jgi:hypothetical protein